MPQAISTTSSESTDRSYQYTTYEYDTASLSRSRRPSTRGTTRPHTARPRTGVSTIGIEYQRIICAVSESRGISPTVGLAFVNLDTAQGILCQISDSQTYVRTLQKLIVLSPSAILISSTSVNPKSKLVSILEQHYDQLNCEVLLADRKYWAEQTGMEYIRQLAPPHDVDSLTIAVGDNYYAVCCFAAVLKHVEVGMNLTIPHRTMRIRYESSEGSMMIDTATIRSLELIQNLHTPKSRDCLFGLLNKTLTPMGSRLLRSNILQPLTDPDELKSRHDALEELSTREDIFFATQAALKNTLDADKTLTSLIITPKQQTLQTTEQAVNNVLALKHFVTCITPIYEAISGVRSKALQEAKRLCHPRIIQPVLRLIDQTINSDTIWASKPVDLRNQRSYAVKSGVNGLLDVARQTFKEAGEDAFNHMQDLATEHDLGLEFQYDTPRQHYFRLQVSELEDRRLPPVFVNVFRKKKHLEFQTLELLKLNQKIRDSATEVLLMSDQSIQQLILQLHDFVPILFKISEAIALLDMLSAFANLVTVHSYVRPSINPTLAFKSARHPIKEQIQTTKLIPNDIYSTQTRRFQIITGCNMSGKSTYIRTAALLTVMAQIGSFVPASFATFPIIRQLLARVSTDDLVEANVSTFSAEMRETAYILNNVDAHSLVIIDELGRGTSTGDGMAIALAIAEALVRSRALVWFATHFRDLATIMAERAGVVGLHLAVETGKTALTMLYRVAEGVEREAHYGLKLARILPFPEEVVSVAEEVAGRLEEREKRNKRASVAVVHARRRKLILHLREQLRQAEQGTMNEVVLRDWLKTLQEEFVVQMIRIDEEARLARETEEADDGDVGDVYMVGALPAEQSRPSTARESRARSAPRSEQTMLFDN
ncbi:MutS domain V-containing protein 2 [Elsinoe australis]|uniref:DNA mismatch repair protein MSH3 n=1 Tax=Elsinoe australis TaxID=40998 RepID=A0A4U7B6G2_9PEZI|nr:MutS domain V-containing protein 2 [Elsinoe australis]